MISERSPTPRGKLAGRKKRRGKDQKKRKKKEGHKTKTLSGLKKTRRKIPRTETNKEQNLRATRDKLSERIND